MSQRKWSEELDDFIAESEGGLQQAESGIQESRELWLEFKHNFKDRLLSLDTEDGILFDDWDKFFADFPEVSSIEELYINNDRAPDYGELLKLIEKLQEE